MIGHNQTAMMPNVPRQTTQIQNGGMQQQNQAPLPVAWITGEDMANSWPIAPNAGVFLMDSNDSYFYIKTADQTGRCSLTKFKYEQVSPVPQTAGNFVDKDTYSQSMDQMAAMIQSLTDQVNNLQGAISNMQQPMMVQPMPMQVAQPVQQQNFNKKNNNRNKGGN